MSQRILDELNEDLREIVGMAVDECRDANIPIDNTVALIAYALLGTMANTVRNNGMPRERFIEICGKVWDRTLEEQNTQ